MNKSDFIKLISSIKGIKVENSNKINIFINNKISGDDLICALDKIYNYENSLKDINILLHLRGLNTELLSEAIKYSLKREDLKDPLMCLNIINLIKIYNTLEKEFFEDPNIYVSSSKDLLNLKLKIKSDLKEFSKKLSIYFISLFKSFNKVTYTPLDEHIKLPDIYRIIIMSTDLLTLSGIFSVSKEFNTSECKYIENSHQYILPLINKSIISTAIMESFLRSVPNKQSLFSKLLKKLKIGK